MMDKYEFNKYLAGHLKEISGNPELSVLEKMHFIRNKKSWKGFSLADNKYYVRTSCPVNGAIFYVVLTVNKLDNEIRALENKLQVKINDHGLELFGVCKSCLKN